MSIIKNIKDIKRFIKCVEKISQEKLCKRNALRMTDIEILNELAHSLKWECGNFKCKDCNGIQYMVCFSYYVRLFKQRNVKLIKNVCKKMEVDITKKGNRNNWMYNKNYVFFLTVLIGDRRREKLKRMGYWNGFKRYQEVLKKRNLKKLPKKNSINCIV